MLKRKQTCNMKGWRYVLVFEQCPKINTFLNWNVRWKEYCKFSVTLYFVVKIN